jgi:hypothetical protein
MFRVSELVEMDAEVIVDEEFCHLYRKVWLCMANHRHGMQEERVGLSWADGSIGFQQWPHFPFSSVHYVDSHWRLIPVWCYAALGVMALGRINSDTDLFPLFLMMARLLCWWKMPAAIFLFRGFGELHREIMSFQFTLLMCSLICIPSFESVLVSGNCSWMR